MYDLNLAIRGGTPTRAKPMPARLAFGPEEEAMVSECLNYYRTRELDPCYQGHFEERYCQAFEDFLGSGYADAVATGTASLYVSIAALSLPKGSEVLVSPITDPGTLSAIILNGLTPKLMDSSPGQYCSGPEEFASRITPKVKAAIVVHSFGRPAPIDEIVRIAKINGIKIIEDCSQAHGASLNGQQVGTFGDIAAFSTMYRKAHITGASGGVVFSRDLHTFQLAAAHADRGKPRWRSNFDDRDPSKFMFPALNLHTNEISCAIGIASLARLPSSIAARQKYVRGVQNGLASSKICNPFPVNDGDSPFIYPVIVDESQLSCTKLDFAKALLHEGIGLNPDYKYLVRDWDWLHQYLADDYETINARKILSSTIFLYLNEKYDQTEIDDTLFAIKKVEAAYSTEP